MTFITAILGTENDDQQSKLIFDMMRICNAFFKVVTQDEQIHSEYQMLQTFLRKLSKAEVSEIHVYSTENPSILTSCMNPELIGHGEKYRMHQL